MFCCCIGSCFGLRAFFIVTSSEIVLRIASNDEMLAEIKSLKSELSELKSDFKELKACLMSLVEKMVVKHEHHLNSIESTFDVGDGDLEKFFET